ncbi:MAG: membrane dipeptidase [Proteocatella sp.]
MIFDGHSDIFSNVANRRARGEKHIFKNHHLKGFKESDIRGGIFVVWIESLYHDNPMARSQVIIKYALEEFEENRDILNQVKNYDDYLIGKNEDKINVILGMEGLSQIEGDLTYLDYLYNDAGVRHAMLTWNEKVNHLGTCWKGDQHEGLTKLGKEAINKMQHLGMIVDTSHLNDAGFWDIMELASQPIIASHSDARALVNHGRNLSDDMIKAIANTGGVIGMNAYREFVGLEKSKQNIAGLANHLEYIAGIAGIDHVGLGFDFTDFLTPEDTGFPNETGDTDCIDGLNSAGEAKYFVEELKSRGFSKEDLEKITHGNFERVIKTILK